MTNPRCAALFRAVNPATIVRRPSADRLVIVALHPDDETLGWARFNIQSRFVEVKYKQGDVLARSHAEFIYPETVGTPGRSPCSTRVSIEPYRRLLDFTLVPRLRTSQARERQ